MKKVIMMVGTAVILTLAVSSAQATVTATGDTGFKKSGFVSLFDQDVVEKRGGKQKVGKQKRKRKHTGLDDGPNHD